MADLAALARTTLARNRFMVLGTVDPLGPPRATPEPFVLFRARVTAAEIHVRRRDFGDGTGADQRMPVQL